LLEELLDRVISQNLLVLMIRFGEQTNVAVRAGRIKNSDTIGSGTFSPRGRPA
jgi:hypothetical protein